ncbi:NAD(P)-binding protein [Phanerochaete sordida]|uniref:NAD(P)-binding protein n=1 Tax=Phanerochaete sordida TaxID=48140 RepID=A0A9P3GJL7_9APHY|nr:NAD(P)-binding protein [Phanerochaete sordida]
MAGKTPVFYIGATGYIGGSVLAKLLTDPSADTLDITALVRSEDKAAKLEKFGVRTVVGSFKDVALVERLAEAAHVVFSMADADDLPMMQAILKGLKQRHAKLGDLPILIHTSGTGILTYGQETKGMAATDVIYDDSDFEQIANIKPEAVHRNVDNAIFEADADGYCRAYIVLPGIIYGIAKNQLVDAGIQNPYSFGIPMLIKAALGRGRAGMVGKGLARWPNVHIDDVVDLYVVLYDAVVEKGPEGVDHGARGYYFGENGESSWADISRAVGLVMVELGLAADAEPTAFSDEELVKYFGSVEIGNYFGTNSRARANHSRALGWKPRYTTQDMLASIKPEVEAILRQQK